MNEKVFLNSLKETPKRYLLVKNHAEALTHPIECVFSKAPSGRKVRIVTESRYVWMFQLPNKHLIEYNDEKIVVYEPRVRQFNDAEREFLRSWYDKRHILEARTSPKIAKHDYFQKNGFEYLLGRKKVNGKRYDFSQNVVIDDNLRGVEKIIFENLD